MRNTSIWQNRQIAQYGFVHVVYYAIRLYNGRIKEQQRPAQKRGEIMATDKEKQYKRQNAFIAEKYDRINVNLQKGTKAQMTLLTL